MSFAKKSMMYIRLSTVRSLVAYVFHRLHKNAASDGSNRALYDPVRAGIRSRRTVLTALAAAEIAIQFFYHSPPKTDHRGNLRRLPIVQFHYRHY